MTAPTAVDRDLVATIDSVLARGGPTAHDPDTGVTFDRALWDALDELGLARLTGSEDHGGSGAGWPEAAALISAAAAHAVALPLVEHDLLAGWLLEQARLPGKDALRTVARLDASGHAAAVPWVRTAERVVLLWHDQQWLVADVPADQLTITPGRNLGGEPRDDVDVDVTSLSGTPVPDRVSDELILRGALARAIQVCGALEACVDLCLAHVTTRTQFGRAIGKFQAVQQLLADAASETALARAAVDDAVRRMDANPRSDTDIEARRFAVAVARSCTGHAASLTVRNAHQIHGALGTTLEHSLHRFTLPALSWRNEFGSVQHWDDLVAGAALDAGGTGLWELLNR